MTDLWWQTSPNWRSWRRQKWSPSSPLYKTLQYSRRTTKPGSCRWWLPARSWRRRGSGQRHFGSRLPKPISTTSATWRIRKRGSSDTGTGSWRITTTGTTSHRCLRVRSIGWMRPRRTSRLPFPRAGPAFCPSPKTAPSPKLNIMVLRPPATTGTRWRMELWGLWDWSLWGSRRTSAGRRINRGRRRRNREARTMKSPKTSEIEFGFKSSEEMLPEWIGLPEQLDGSPRRLGARTKKGGARF